MQTSYDISNWSALAESADAARYEGTAVNPRTFLATDYLNHFNEAIMLLEMAAQMPDCLDDLADWAPKSYEQHFNDSVFKDRHLCIEAYALADPLVKGRLEDVVSCLNEGVAAALFDLAAYAQDPVRLEHICKDRSRVLRDMIDRASGIINGVGVDEDMPTNDPNEASEHIDATQAAVDALFD